MCVCLSTCYVSWFCLLFSLCTFVFLYVLCLCVCMLTCKLYFPQLFQHLIVCYPPQKPSTFPRLAGHIFCGFKPAVRLVFKIATSVVMCQLLSFTPSCSGKKLVKTKKIYKRGNFCLSKQILLTTGECICKKYSSPVRKMYFKPKHTYTNVFIRAF